MKVWWLANAPQAVEQIPIDVAKILSVAQKLVYVQKILAIITNNGQVVRHATKNIKNMMKRKTMMTSYNQRLAIVIINVEGFKNLKIDLHDWKLYSKAYSKPSQGSEMKLFEKIVNSWKAFTIFSKSSNLCEWLGSAYASGIVALFKCSNFHSKLFLFDTQYMFCKSSELSYFWWF